MRLQVSLDERIQIEQEKLWNEQKKTPVKGMIIFVWNYNMEFFADDFDRRREHYWENRCTIAKITATN